jgi:acyl transferase domain-containing protein/3-hydroxymyristoyl/3-hydroxydecanoyl-(acyl carrier protein) dehydratase
MPADPRSETVDSIAIVGIGGLFPGSSSLDQFWSNICECVDSTSDVPPGRWLIDPDEAYDSRLAQADRVYSRRGGFVALERVQLDEVDLGGPAPARLDPVFRLALYAALEAWRDARTKQIDRRRAGVVFGNIVLPTETVSAWSRDVLAAALEEQLGLGSKDPGHVETWNAFPAGLPAAAVARALGLGGVAYTIDAACATSLYSLELAAAELRAGRADAMLCGGVSRPDALYIQMGFSQLRALSARGRASPFDHRADGLVAGEGAGMFVLKRLGDALRDGDHIYGLVAAVGLSNDNQGDLLAPSSEGQLRAMRLAYGRAGWSPTEVDLIECHATGAPVGDAVEAKSLKTLWGETSWRRGQCVIGSVKSNIGHALTAAGAAGLLKVLMALKNRRLPPTANFERSLPALGLEDSPFRVLTEAVPWSARKQGQPRRAAVSGFGFGGINAHVLIEEWVPGGSPRVAPPRAASRRESESSGPERRRASGSRGTPIAIVGMSAQIGSIEGTQAFQEWIFGAGRRITSGCSRRWWRIERTEWFRRRGWGEHSFPGLCVDSIESRVDMFRIPPAELAEMLPQQLLMLKVARAALLDARWDAQLALRTGVLIGIGLDLSTTNYHLRWSLPALCREWNNSLGLGLGVEELEGWAGELHDAVGPALTANRTMGSLGGMVASRIAREFRIGGPSFTVSSDETSGIQALAIALDWLRRGELDAAVIGAVDLAGDVRAVLARSPRPEMGSQDIGIADGAVSLVLKRLADAERDHDQIYALICHGDSGWSRIADALGEVPETDAGIGYIELQWADEKRANEHASRLDEAVANGDRTGVAADCALGSVLGDLGWAGAATGLASVAKAAICLNQQILPGSRLPLDGVPQIAGRDSSFFRPAGAQFWLNNRASGPRRACVAASSLGGGWHHLVLEEFDERRTATAIETPVGGRAIARSQPLGARPLGLFAIEAHDEQGLLDQIGSLVALLRDSPQRQIDRLARDWWQGHPNNPQLRYGLAIIADGVTSLECMLGLAERRIREELPDESAGVRGASRVYFRASPTLDPKRVAFVYPGLGNQFVGMCRAISSLWPDVLRAQDQENNYLRDQLNPGVWWSDGQLATLDDHRLAIIGSVSASCVMTDVLCHLGIQPGAAIGYSLGETAALIALGAWSDRAGLRNRLWESPLFHTELAGSFAAARRVWRIPPGEPVDWSAGIVPRSLAAVRAAIRGAGRVYPLIKNADDETVIGGFRRDVEAVVGALACSFSEIPTVSTVHCELGLEAQDAYRALHDLETVAPPGITFYSGVWGRSYPADRRSAGDAIAAQASRMIDFPAVIERAYADGLRVFLEVGPGTSCTRLIGRILNERPHFACSAAPSDADPLHAVFAVLGNCVAERIPVDLGSLYRHSTPNVADPISVPASPHKNGWRTIRVAVRNERFEIPPIPSARIATHPGTQLSQAFLDAERATALAHETFLRATQNSVDLIGKQLARQFELIETWSRHGGVGTAFEGDAPDLPIWESLPGLHSQHVVLDRAACLEFAVGSIAAVFGPEFAEVDRFPARVRLPAEPLMLVDRVLAIEGRPRSLEGGRIVTEHDIRPDAWYLDVGRIAPSIAIEAGQADLMLCGFLGVDFETRGRAVYRLLDATVTFHQGLPRPPAVIRYDIRIERFFTQGKTILFRFQLDASVGGEPLVSMRDGCAGFFTPDELATGRGIIPHAHLIHPASDRPVEEVSAAIPVNPIHLDSSRVAALRAGDFSAAFGRPFDRQLPDDLLPLPGGRMALVDRVEILEPKGGAHRRGFIKAEAAIRPGDWHLECHFVGDRVMPGTLMYEGCLQALRILLYRLGWIGRRGDAHFEPVPGAPIRLKCRGQVVESSSRVTYEITINERGFRPQPYAIADALILVDDRPIVEIMGVSLQLSGVDRRQLGEIWSEAAAARSSMLLKDKLPGRPVGNEKSLRVIFDHDRILTFAVGKPSAAFGERYRPFDDGRFLARLPGPPYQFLDRVLQTDAKAWVMAAGCSAEAEFDVDAADWFFAADRQEVMPFAILLEVALQACGWLSAYMGSALNSDEELKFRNLGGRACQHQQIRREPATLRTRVKVTKITQAAGMILQFYEFEIYRCDQLVYDGTAEFGFFPFRSLAEQVGIRDASRHVLTAAERKRAVSFAYPADAAYPDERWRMIDRVDEMVLDGGPHGLGVVRGSTLVDPGRWFFSAHFLNDPVWPGSLGLESLLQLLKVVAVDHWGDRAGCAFESPALGHTHAWTYRGQIVPVDHRVVVQAEIKARDDVRHCLVADGHLEVDGKIIYQMHDFALAMRGSGAREIAKRPLHC